MIDAHHHFWKYDPLRHGWISDEMSVIRRDFLPADLHPEMEKTGVKGVVSVQADQREEETLFLLECAEKNGWVKGVVGWADLRSPAVNERLAHFAKFPKLKGFRHIVQAEGPGFLLSPEFNRGIKALADHRYTYDILVYEHQLRDVVKFLGKHPSQPFVIDHIAKPKITTRSYDEWARLMTEVASFPNVFCKVSGMVTEAAWNRWTYDDFVRYLELVMNAFGADRLMYGSDWPVCLVAASYEDQLAIVTRFFSRLSPGEQQKIFEANAVRFYNLNLNE